jgi:hypothetical protein
VEENADGEWKFFPALATMFASMDLNAFPKIRCVTLRAAVHGIEKCDAGIHRSGKQREAFATRASRNQGAYARAPQPQHGNFPKLDKRLYHMQAVDPKFCVQYTAYGSKRYRLCNDIP